MTQKRQLEIAEEREQILKHLNRLTSVMENTSDIVKRFFKPLKPLEKRFYG